MVKTGMDLNQDTICIVGMDILYCSYTMHEAWEFYFHVY